MNNWTTYALGGYLAFAGLIALGMALYSFPTAAGLAVGAMGRGLGPWRTGGSDPRIVSVSVPGKNGEPAHPSYWTSQLWTDLAGSAPAAADVLRRLLIGRWLGTGTWNLLRGRRLSATNRAGLGRAVPREGLITALALVLTAPGFGIGAVLGATAAAVFLLLVLVILGALLGAVLTGLAASAIALRAVDRAGLLARSIRMKCPYPGCYQPIELPVYHCPGCRAAHRRLRAGRYGVLRRICGCGHRLRTSFLTGRHRLTAYCPHCDLALPRGLGTTRIVHIPIVGGTSSGKTMLMAAMIAGLRSWSDREQLSVTYATSDDQNELQRITSQLDQTGWVHRTAAQQPRAFMLQITRGRTRRLLYLYDPMGETFGDSVVVREQQYLAHTDGVVLVADVLAEPEVRRELGGADAQRAVDARPSPEGPKDTYDRLAGEFAAMSGRRARTPVATVVTKRDVLDQLDAIPAPGARIDEWLAAIGLGDLVQSLEHDFGATRYWAVSAHAATGAGALDGESRRAAEPVLWLLSRSGLPVKPLLTGESAKR
ncbi:TRAFAC clade GTPase domain-containing protein [Streptomyces sp. NPDC055078]